MLSATTYCLAADEVPAKPPHPGLVGPTNDTERLLDKMLIPEVNFRACNMFDCINFLQINLDNYVSSHKSQPLRYVYDIEAVRYLVGEKDGVPEAIPPTFTAKKEITTANQMPENIVTNAPHSQH
jgi:hypothetical protein